jgi:hypothetical protein
MSYLYKSVNNESGDFENDVFNSSNNLSPVCNKMYASVNRHFLFYLCVSGCMGVYNNQESGRKQTKCMNREGRPLKSQESGKKAL